MKKSTLKFKFCETEEKAQTVCKTQNSIAYRSAYMIKKYPAHYTPWESKNATDPMHWVAIWHEI